MVAHARLPDAQYSLLPSAPTPKRKVPQTVELQLVPPLVIPEPSDAVRDLRASLQPAIAARLRSGSELVQALARERRDEVIPTTLAPIDALLDGGLARGKVTEIAGKGGRWSIVFAALAAATSMGEAAVLIDTGDHFDPQLGELAGIDLQRLLWVRPKTLKQAVTAAEMLGATGFQLVVLDAGLPPIRGRRVPDASWVRLARTAEAHGCTLFVSAPYALTGTTSEAMLYAPASRPRWIGQGVRLLAGFETRVRLEKHRRKRTGESAMVFFLSAAAEPPLSDASHSKSGGAAPSASLRAGALQK